MPESRADRLPARSLYVVQPEPKQSSKLVKVLSEHFGTGAKGDKVKKRVGNSQNNSNQDASLAGEYANVLEEEYLDFVLFEIEPVDGHKE